jgi:rhodanese-related sulfurtransferase
MGAGIKIKKTKKNMFMKVMVIVSSVLLLMSCSTSGDSQSANAQEHAVQENYVINVELFNMKMKEANVVVLDVRTPQEVAVGVIGTPTVIDYRGEGFKEQILALDKSKTYLVYCKSGGRSARTKAVMDENGFQTVYDLVGGITAWTDAGMPLQ